MIERPLLLPLVALITGISATTLFGVQVSPWFTLPAGLLFLSGLMFKRPAYFVLSVALCALSWGSHSAQPFINPSLPAHHVARHIVDSPVPVVGIIYQRPERKEANTRLYLDIESVAGAKRSGKVLVSIKNGPVTVMTGDRISLVTRLREPRNFGIPGEYDFRRALAVKGIFVTGFLGDAADLVLLQNRAAFTFQRRIDETAAWLCRFIDSAVPPPESGILQALLVGERGSVPPAVEQLYARTGVNHILSISGFHVGILAVVVYQLLSLMARRSERLLLYNIRWKLLLATFPLLVWYLLVSGAAPATVRSVLMIGACFIALLLERESDSVNVLALAACAILAVSPGALFDISFQLSFIALWGILVITPLMLGVYQGPRKGPVFMTLQFGAVSAAAIAATLFPVAYSFHRVSLVGLLSNCIVVPLLGYGAVVSGFTALLISPLLPFPATLLLKLAAQLVVWSNAAMVWLDQIPRLPRFTPTLIEVALSICMLLAFTIFTSRLKKVIAVVVFVSIACAFRYTGETDAPDTMIVHFFSVGQGESTLIRFSDGTNMLVDGGGSLQEGGYDIGERLLGPALWSLGVEKIDRMVLSHPHPDHVKGLLFIAENFTVGEFWESGYSSGFPAYHTLKDLLERRGVRMKVVNSSTEPFTAGGALIQPLAPPVPAPTGDTMYAAALDANEDSMIFRLSQGKFSLLFTGDAGFEAESRLLRHPQNLRSSVLKVGHHGSRYSSSRPFLRAVSPRLSLISAGYQNSFGLPASETVADIRRIRSEIHRTDRDGTLELTATPSTGAFNTRKYPAVMIDTY